MGTILIDNIEVPVADHERLNGIQAAARAGVEIPHYCWHPGLSVVASCRMCLVETGAKDPATGKITMLPRVVPACQTPAKDGTVFITNSDKVKQYRAMVEEDLLIDHPIDCPICDKAGECLLQDYYFAHGQPERRADLRPFTSRRKEMGDTVTLFIDRCVMCTRCVRFTREVSGTSELMVINRGSHEEIDVFDGFPLDNKLSGNVVDLCPVGALGDRDFLYKQRVWFMKKHNGVCATCATGCSITIEENQDSVFRLKPRENLEINKWWMCDEGRYNYGYIHQPDRLNGPKRRKEKGYNAQDLLNIEWSDVPRMVTADIRAELAGGGRLAMVISPFQTVEEAYLLCQLARSFDPQAILALGPVPVVGQDETFPGGFTIRAEKCPNRRGVEAVLAHYGPILPWNDFLTKIRGAANGESLRVLWVAGGYQHPWIDATTAGAFAQTPLVITQDLFESPLSAYTTYQLPGGGYAERAGSYVNYNQRLQSFSWAVRPPAGCKVEGHVAWSLLGRQGLYNAGAILQELAAEIPAFSAVTGLNPIPPQGVDLRVNQLAAV
ncbi:MAG: 2Fe-2S iron-sulfur cluster-binding protein [Pirellulales bacterium]|nr:2Fe-2S iron-sulfur cluster-binding protein [Pirellulales bacterium]